MAIRQVVIGASSSLLAHALTLAVPLLLALRYAAPDSTRTSYFLYGTVIAQFCLLLVTFVVGGILNARPERKSAGAAILSGWAVGLLCAPFAWYHLAQEHIWPK